MTHLRILQEEPPKLTPRQREILGRALELVQETGLSNLTLKRVAERVGFTEAAIYRHFPSKRDLIFGLIAMLEQRLLGEVGAIADDARLSPTERIERMVRRHVAVLEGTQGLPLLLVAEGLATGDQELVERLGVVMLRYRALLTRMLEQLPERPSLPPELQAVVFLGLPAALGLLLRAHPQFKPSPAEIDALVRYYVRSLARPMPASAEDPV